MSRKKLPIPNFKNIQEEAKFWDTHDSEDYRWEPAPEVKFSKNLASVYQKVIPARIDEKTKRAIEKVAKKKKVGTSTAAGMLLREHLAELKVL